MNVKFLFSLLLLLVGTSTVNGCTVLKKQSSNETINNNNDKADQCLENKLFNKQTKINLTASVETQLLAAAQSIEESLNTLAAAEKAENAPILNVDPLITPEGGMGGLADVDWSGPIGPLVDKIANMTNYRVKVLGNDPPIPVLVTISAKRAVIADILQNASFQAGKRAHILVFPDSRLIEIRYLS